MNQMVTHWERALCALVGAATALVGCGGSKFDGTLMHLFIAPSVLPSRTNYFSVEMFDEAGHCPLSINATLAINGTTYPFGSCTGASDLFEGNPSFALQATDGDNQAEMNVAGLVPGLDATIVSSADGQVVSGGIVTVSIPSVFQGQSPVVAEFNNTNPGDTYAGTATYPTVSNSQTADIPVPQHPATYDFWVEMGVGATGGLISADVFSCKGFAHCYAEAIDDLGPMLINVTP